MQILGFLNTSVHSSCHRIVHNNGSKKLTASLSSIASFLAFSVMLPPNAYAHVSHVLSAQQYANIKSGYPDIEIIASIVTGIIVLSAIFVQSFQKYRRKLETC